jgi:hypothetical protein
MERILLIDHDLRGVPAVCRCFAIALVSIVGAGHTFITVLLFAGGTVLTDAAGVYEAAYTCQITYFKFPDMVTDLDYAPYDLMARDHRIDRAAPLIADLMYIRVADTAVQDIYLYVVCSDLPSVYAKWPYGADFVFGCICFGGYHLFVVLFAVHR